MTAVNSLNTWATLYSSFTVCFSVITASLLLLLLLMMMMMMMQTANAADAGEDHTCLLYTSDAADE